MSFAASTLPQCKAADLQCLPDVMTRVIKVSGAGKYFTFIATEIHSSFIIIDKIILFVFRTTTSNDIY